MSNLILVIDDDQPLLELYESILTDDGYEVMLSQDVFDDVTSIEHTHPDLIILDFIFGWEAQGLQMLEALKRHAPTASIPIIVSTAASGTTIKALETYLDDPRICLIVKPFEIEDVSAAVSHLLRLNDQPVQCST